MVFHKLKIAFDIDVNMLMPRIKPVINQTKLSFPNNKRELFKE